MNADPLPRDEVAASVSAVRELGSDYDAAVAEALAERLEHSIDARIETRLAQRSAPESARPGEDKTTGYRFAMAMGSMVLAVPLTAITAGTAGALPVAVLWVAIAVINIAFILGTRRRG